MIEFTILNAIAVFMGMFGAGIFISGLIDRWFDDMAVGILLMLFGWWLL